MSRFPLNLLTNLTMASWLARALTSLSSSSGTPKGLMPIVCMMFDLSWISSALSFPLVTAVISELSYICKVSHSLFSGVSIFNSERSIRVKKEYSVNSGLVQLSDPFLVSKKGFTRKWAFQAVFFSLSWFPHSDIYHLNRWMAVCITFFYVPAVIEQVVLFLNAIFSVLLFVQYICTAFCTTFHTVYLSYFTSTSSCCKRFL